MAQDNLICVHHCSENVRPPNEHFPGEEGVALEHYILYALTPRGLVDRAVLEEMEEDFKASRQGAPGRLPARRPHSGQAMRLGPFSNLAGVEAMALALAERIGAPSVSLLTVPEYNEVLGPMLSLETEEGPQGAFFQALFAAARPLKDDERRSRKGLLGKIFN